MEAYMARAKVEVSTLVNADLATVWNCFVQPEHILKWNHASEDWETSTAENDVRTGGYFSYKMRAKDGSFEFNFGGVYHKVTPMEEIVYTLGDGRRVDITFGETEGGIKLTEIFDAEEVHDIEMQRQGWQAILDNFKKYTEL